jgi:RNA recognition motif-containing protein
MAPVLMTKKECQKGETTMIDANEDDTERVDGIPKKTLRVQNISDETSPTDLRKLLSKYGPIFKVQIYSEDPNQVTAFLTMSRGDAKDALHHLNGQRWRGQRLKLNEEKSWWGD